MNGLCLLLTLLCGAVSVEATLLDGTRIRGDLTALTPDAAELQTEAEPRKLSRTEILQLEFGAKEETVQPVEHAEIRLVDGSRLWGGEIDLAAGEATFVSPSLGKVTLPVASLRDIRYGELTGVAAAWEELRGTESANDRIIIRKGDSLDFVAGSVGGISAGQIAIVIGGQEAKVPTGRVFAVLYATRKQRLPTPACEIFFKNGERVPAASLTLEGEQFAVVTTFVPAGAISSADFGLGKIRSLTDVPRQASYDKVNPFWSDDDQARLQALRVDHVPWGRTHPTPLRVGGKSYSRGLWLHSGTTVRFQLDRQYRKLQAIAGIDENPAGRDRVQPKVRLTMTGDGKPLFDKVIAWDDPELKLDVETTNVRVLEVAVTSAEKSPYYGACEHLDLVEAKLIK